MSKGLLKRAERQTWREGNSPYKPLLRAMGITSTDRRYLKEWLSKRTHCTNFVEGHKEPVKVCYDNMVGCFETWAQACYEVALLERKKGNSIIFTSR